MKEDAEAFEQFRGRCLDHGFPWLRRQRLLHELLARRVVRVVIVVRRRRFRLLPIKWRINPFAKIHAYTRTLIKREILYVSKVKRWGGDK